MTVRVAVVYYSATGAVREIDENPAWRRQIDAAPSLAEASRDEDGGPAAMAGRAG